MENKTLEDFQIGKQQIYSTVCPLPNTFKLKFTFAISYGWIGICDPGFENNSISSWTESEVLTERLCFLRTSINGIIK